MRTNNKKPQDAIFIITKEDSCPLYDLGDEIKVENYNLTVSSLKPGCLQLASKIIKIVKPEEKRGFPQLGRQPSSPASKKSSYDCGGCDGTIQFEYKQEKEYATLQMKMLRDAEMQRRKRHLQKFFGILRRLDIFDTLDDDSLSDLTLLLDLKTILPDKVIIKKDDHGSHLYIVLRGSVAMMDSDGSKILQIGPGEIFGEMSLLSGEPAANAIHTVEATQIAMLSNKNFKRVLKKHPILQMFLFKLLAARAQTMTLHSGNITSGMTGELDEIPAVDLFQLIHSSKKTGVIKLTTGQEQAEVYFKDGEIIHTRFLELQDKEALFALLKTKQGRFSYARGIPEDLQNRPPLGGFMGLMMEGVQRIDEN